MSTDSKSVAGEQYVVHNMTEAEAKAETDAKAEAKVIITRPRPAIFVHNSGSTDLLGQRDLLGSFETANYLI